MISPPGVKMKDRYFHVTTYKKLDKYKRRGYIKPPVRAWMSLFQAMRFSETCGRRVILRLIDNGGFELNSEIHESVISHEPYSVENI
jgi:hypothetical protein